MGWRDRLLNTKPETVGRALSKGPHGHGSMPQLSTYNRGGRILSQQDLGRGGMKTGGRVGLKKGNDVPHGLKEVKTRKWYDPTTLGVGINVATGQREKPDLGGKLPRDIAKRHDDTAFFKESPGFSGGYTWNPNRRKKGKRLESVADKGVYVHKAPTKDREGDKTWKTRVKAKKRMEAAIAKKKRKNKEYSTKQEVKPYIKKKENQ